MGLDEGYCAYGATRWQLTGSQFRVHTIRSGRVSKVKVWSDRHDPKVQSHCTAGYAQRQREGERVLAPAVSMSIIYVLRSSLWTDLPREHCSGKKGMKQERDGGTGLDQSSWLGLLVSIPLHVGELRAQGTAQETAVAERSVNKHTHTHTHSFIIPKQCYINTVKSQDTIKVIESTRSFHAS